MSMSIRTNVGALNAQRNLTSNQSTLGNTLNKLSSGYRITKAGDDAAGLAISEKLRAQIGGLNQAIRNANDAISMIQTAEGGMQEIHSMLQRMNQLATQAANGTLSDANRSYINTELQALKDEINAIAERTKFNGMSLLDGSLADGQVGGTAGGVTRAGNGTVSVDTSGSTLAAGTYRLSFDAVTSTLSILDADGQPLSTPIDQVLADTGADGQAASYTLGGIVFSFTDDGSAAITAAEQGAALHGTTLVVGQRAQFQIGADATDTLSVDFKSVRIASGSAFDGLYDALVAFGADGGQTVENANALIAAVSEAIDTVSSMRSSLGAAQNRLDHTIANLAITAENLSASESQIRDADIAEETAAMSKGQVLMQAGISVLAQANQQPQMALKLLG